MRVVFIYNLIFVGLCVCFVVFYLSRNFDRHFQEWRHAHGMRCLGIPNTKHFHDIILIQVGVRFAYQVLIKSLLSGGFVQVGMHYLFFGYSLAFCRQTGT